MSDLMHRFTDTHVVVLDADGEPLRNTPVTVEQTRHAFGFGNIGFDFIEWIAGPRLGGEPTSKVLEQRMVPHPDTLAKDLLEVFNTVTLPFYWRGFESVRGETDTTRLRRTAEWFAARGVAVKGHPLVWHTLAPQWLLEVDEDDVEAEIRQRIARDVADFAGVVDLWDVINEVVILPVFTAEDNAVTRLAQRKGRVGMVKMAFEEARTANPSAHLVLNDFDLSQDYERLIEGCLDAGIQIDAIGLQTHMHQGYRGTEQIWNLLERFSRFGLPLQLTETTILSGDLMPAEIIDLNHHVVDSWPSTPDGEARQAEEIVDHYRNVVAHPAVESLTYWGITDHGAWLGAPCGLIREDGTRKPAFDSLRDLVRNEWWYPKTQLMTDSSGGVAVHGFAGRYRIATAAFSTEVDLPRGKSTTTVSFRRADPGAGQP